MTPAGEQRLLEAYVQMAFIVDFWHYLKGQHEPFDEGWPEHNKPHFDSTSTVLFEFVFDLDGRPLLRNRVDAWWPWEGERN